MQKAGIEAINFFGGMAYLNVKELSDYRKLDLKRFDNLLMKEKSVAMPFEDPVTFGVNAAKPIIDSLSQEEKDRIELLITCSESGIDFSKSISTYIHDYLGLSRNCRMFEMKNACYAGTAGVQMAINFILSQTSPGAKALVISSDISRFAMEEGGDVLTSEWIYAEPSVGAGAVAILISEKPNIFQIDIGANGYYGHEVFDTCRPTPDSEALNSDVSLMSFLECFEEAFAEYCRRVADVNFKDTFQYLAIHTPFGGMAKGAHRTMMRKLYKLKTKEIEEDFEKRVAPGMTYCQRVANIMGGTVYLSLISTIENGDFDVNKRIGCYSYGSGCCSEFFSGIVTKEGQNNIRKMKVKEHLDSRYCLSMDEYERVFAKGNSVKFGTRNTKPDIELIPGVIANKPDKKLLVLDEIKEYYRKYRWL
ncbi:hydroxymethylglutaryl-CoA synthase family protein [Anaeromicropila populeti]|uniref:Hydroxymethylglutaryl-CoA synthase n=1 Tax=Anaeromicropila populeti TaxID=37658 RepID=A0A1I6IZR9_9FIRM|nr:hydroxymethylglutaryl-CoA synthase family protein [Anaeromicropila populeti]SFR72252.1 hydroxymethylglutaryl-CoA synthase [Anaeromicropila populeti]